MIQREHYMKVLRAYRNKPVVKVLTGLRRAGKSSLLLLLQDELLASGIPPERIIKVNYDNMDFIDMRDARSLHHFIKEKMVEDDRYFILIDEIQESVRIFR